MNKAIEVQEIELYRWLAEQYFSLSCNLEYAAQGEYSSVPKLLAAFFI